MPNFSESTAVPVWTTRAAYSQVPAGNDVNRRLAGLVT